jgi:tetratricopeptide (TPR) repeat protein
VLLYRLVTGAYPVSGRTLTEVCEAHARGTRLPLAAARPDLPGAFVRIVDRALDPDPRNRYDSPDGLRSELRSMSKHRWRLVAAVLLPLAMVSVGFTLWSGANRAASGESSSSASLNPEVELVQVVNLAEKGRFEDAYARALRARAAAPTSPDAASAVAYALTYAGFVDAAVRAIDDAVAANPDYLTQNGWWTPTALLYQRDFTRFLQAIEHSDTSSSRVYRAIADTERGQRSKAIPHVAGTDAGGADVFKRLAAALHAGLTDRTEAAVTIVRSIAQQRHSAGDTDGEITFKQAQILSVAGDTPTALAALDEAVAQGFVCVACFERSVLLEPVRALSGYQPIKERARARQLAFAKRFGISNRLSQ